MQSTSRLRSCFAIELPHKRERTAGTTVNRSDQCRAAARFAKFIAFRLVSETQLLHSPCSIRTRTYCHVDFPAAFANRGIGQEGI
jgi:hypothetical protein